MGTSFCPVYSKSLPTAEERKYRWTGYPEIIWFAFVTPERNPVPDFTERNSN